MWTPGSEGGGWEPGILDLWLWGFSWRVGIHLRFACSELQLIIKSQSKKGIGRSGFGRRWMGWSGKGANMALYSLGDMESPED